AHVLNLSARRRPLVPQHNHRQREGRSLRKSDRPTGDRRSVRLLVSRATQGEFPMFQGILTVTAIVGALSIASTAFAQKAPSPCKGLVQEQCNGACQWHPALSGTVDIAGKPTEVKRKAYCSFNAFKAQALLSKQQKAQ